MVMSWINSSKFSKGSRMKQPIVCALIVYLLFTHSWSAHSQSPGEVAIKKDIVYGHAGGIDLKLDIGQPEGKGPFPVIIFFHGGGWQQGDKSHMHKWIRKYTPLGYVSVSAGYRFAPQFKWPSQVQDAKTAVRYLRAHAGELGINPDRIGVMGESAGGYLALMLGVTSPNDSLEGENEYAKYPSNVQAVVSFVSATDFTLPGLPLTPALEAEMQQYYKKSLKEVRTDFTGASSPDDPILKRISVVSYVDKGDAPVLMFYGDSDPFVSIEHAYKLRHSLENANVPNELVIVNGGGHGWTGTLQEETTRKMSAFFERLLKTQ
jgi:acetyl esterase/lipase